MPAFVSTLIGYWKNLIHLLDQISGIYQFLLQVCELDMLESLTLHNNGLPSLRREIGMLTNLVTLSLTGNYLAELPPTVNPILVFSR